MPGIDRDKISDKIVRRAQSAPRYLITLNKFALTKTKSQPAPKFSRGAPTDMMPGPLLEHPAVRGSVDELSW